MSYPKQKQSGKHYGNQGDDMSMEEVEALVAANYPTMPGKAKNEEYSLCDALRRFPKKQRGKKK